MANEVTVKRNEVRNLIAGMKDRITEILPKHLTPERMVRVLQNAVSRNPKLLQCTQASLCESIITASEFGLEPNTPLGLCYVIPYKDQATFQMGYRGLVELAYRSGRVTSVYAEPVYEHDKFVRSLGLHRDLIHEPAAGERGKVIGYYGVFVLKGDTEPIWHYMTVAEVEAHGKRYSKSYSKPDGIWQTNFDAAARKTVLIQAARLAPKSINDNALELLYKGMSSDTDSIYHEPIDVTAKPDNGQRINTLDDVVDVETGEVSEPDDEALFPENTNAQML